MGSAQLIILLIVIRPPLEVACSFVVTAGGGVLLHGGRLQLGVVHVALRLIHLVLMTWGWRVVYRQAQEALLCSRVVRRQEEI